MLITTNAIVLSKLKYRDNDLIVKCYTQQLGLVSIILRGIFKSKRGQSKSAYYQPLSQLQLVIDYKNNRSLQSVKETKLNHLYTSLHTNVLKGSIVMFLAEVLSNALKEEEQNEILFSYIETTLQWLDAHSEYSNFHLLFLLNLTKYLGFYPDLKNIEFNYFNLSDGKFEKQEQSKYSIKGENLSLLKQLLGTTFDTLSLVKVNGKQRQSFLNMILLYFELHLGSFRTSKSLQVFNQVFS
ncbi:DNA repair protein RecO [Thalassobellus suaedae]|uniref:DNA repair protein RecO n=1 Tax=Thalassobellus suaedae TaxID=3074124 RepID=A0ABY9Y6D7_9FLAO|nr:DNA repair protein RecO [Flavobacteriaceae bacterium HL-DH10]